MSPNSCLPCQVRDLRHGVLEWHAAVTDEEIDHLVYESYELTEEGIAIIDHQEI